MGKKVAAIVVIGLAALTALAGEGRVPIWQVGSVISNPGKYIVTRNINAAGSGGPAITVAASDVDLDLNGFVVSNDNTNPVVLAGGVGNLTIHNGTLRGGIRSLDMTSAAGARKLLLERVNSLKAGAEAFFLVGVTDFSILRCNILAAGQMAIYIDGTPIPGVQGTIEGNRVEESGGGIWVIHGSSVAIVNNRIEDLQLMPSPSPPAQGAIVYDYSDAGLIAQNTIEKVQGMMVPTDGNGIYLGDSKGSKIHNNVVRDVSDDGIDVAGYSDDNLLLDNVVSHCSRDGVRIEGAGNHVDRNLLNSNCTGGGGNCWGLHFVNTPWGGQNTFGRNTARRNGGLPAACPGIGGIYPPTTDFCDQQTGNSSFRDNYMPSFF